MPNNWKTYKLGEGISTIIDYRGKTPPKSLSGIPLISAASIKKGKLDFTKASFISKEDYKSWTTRGFTEPDDVMITTEAPVGEVALYPNDGKTYLISRRVIALRTDEIILHSKYLLQLLQYKPTVDSLLSNNRGSTVPRVLKTDITDLKLTLPPLQEQRAIASILTAIDDKIELNLQQNKTLEEMAMALYKHWFVDFGPFQNGEFVASELGMIPKGWEVKSIGDVIETLGGGTPKTTCPEYWEKGEIDWYSPTDLTKSQSLYSLGTAKKITALGLKKSSAKMFPARSLLMSSRATIGAITINRKEACTNQGFITMLPNEILSLYQLHGWTIANMAIILSKANGSTFKEISKTNFRNLPIVIGRNIQEYIDSCKSNYDQIENNILENQTLTKLRDTLLPKLISGEVRVKDIEKTVNQMA